MKIDLNWRGEDPAKSDYAMLRASIAAAQASTPTASASERAKGRSEASEALTCLFGDADLVDQARLHGSFNPAQAHDADGDA
ncbi:hypothetical protein [uncultured Sphingomonas sp.]|uniref:hypothetical protein n=1 Tax=uncultured Sphingomonas sp. TaxID=158754 RepID=UPI0025F24DC7|nr:hypothetical protein [uncultured Sphingomonas sp.]